MKNLRKLSKKELKSVNGGAQTCYYLANGTKVCPCPAGEKWCPDGCRPTNTFC
ncbi:MAG: bacteriocin [Candidatus Chryseobacterium colombiense]|nr:bacteriocin [Chryseobacterium sp.]WEK69462.1 MAG: bacteriocin [Chryseobacterium sp.]